MCMAIPPERTRNMSDCCPICGQTLKKAHKESMSRAKLTMLKTAADYVITHERNEVPATVFHDISSYNNFQKLRYHGLIHYWRNSQGNEVRGKWLITRNGWAFLRGELSIPKYIIVKNNHLESRSDTLVSVRDVYYGSEILQTTFEYFDEAGRPVGFRPTLQPDRQVVLL